MPDCFVVLISISISLASHKSTTFSSDFKSPKIYPLPVQTQIPFTSPYDDSMHYLLVILQLNTMVLRYCFDLELHRFWVCNCILMSYISIYLDMLRSAHCLLCWHCSH